MKYLQASELSLEMYKTHNKIVYGPTTVGNTENIQSLTGPGTNSLDRLTDRLDMTTNSVDWAVKPPNKQTIAKFKNNRRSYNEFLHKK